MFAKTGFVKPFVVIFIGLISTISATYYWFGGGSDENVVDNQLLFEAFRGEFVSTIMETGQVESSSNVEIRCEVKSRGTAGTAILKIAPEGDFVKKGDFLVQFDDSNLKDRYIEQQIQVAQNEAALIQAENDLSAAKKMVDEYDQGTKKQELAAVKAEIAVASENLERAREYLKFSQKLSAKNFISRSELQADEFSVRKADSELKLAEQKLDVLIKLTEPRTKEQLQAEVKKLTASLKAARFTLLLSQEREKELAEQVAKCRIVAPKDGQVVYANENDRDNSIVIEEGTVIRDGQEVIFLPDPSKMQVRTKVNDSKINLVKPGNPVEIRLDSAPDTAIQGVVREAAAFPMPQRWYQAPIEYEVFVDVTEKNPLVKSGLRSKARIIVDKQQNVLQIPASALVRKAEGYYALVAENNRYVARSVTIGANNDKFVIIQSGLAEGDKVLINPEKQKEKINFPDS
ncbi:MAG: HlyD family efflux transporter periplasmic adaptor subunit [Planctomycetota bacterium]|nr:HlyD family efflux transporter periplasmic adaptor subunit [Planctomycetota bacterium]